MENDSHTPQAEYPPDSQNIFAQLRDVLSELYLSESDSHVIVADAGLDAGSIAFSSRAKTNWHNILAQSIRQNRLPVLLGIARNDYLDNQPLTVACADYHRFIEQGGWLESPSQLPVDGDVITAHIGEQANVVAVGKQITQIVYQGVLPQPLDAAKLKTANAKLAKLPVNRIPPVAPLPPGSRMSLSFNPLFVGREDDLHTLAVALKGGKTVTVSQIAAATGLGGIGKTQLAVAFVHHYGQFFLGGVYWLSFADANAIPTEIAACGATMSDLRADFVTLDLETQVRLVLAAWQSPLPRLLIFDNCEEPALLAQWRPSTVGSRVLVTSRRYTWDAALGVSVLELDTLARAYSIALLRKFRPDLESSDPDLDQIALALGDLPLALHLAGSYLARYRHAVSPGQYLTQLRQPNLLQHRSLQAGDLSPTGHVQHVERTFALSHEQLRPDNPQDALALALLARSAWFAPGQPIPHALLLASMELVDEEEWALQATDALAQLANLGLLEMAADGDLLIHRLVAHFVQRADARLTETAQRAVAATLLTAANRLNNAGVPGPLLTWQSHLRHITDVVHSQADEQAAGLCNELGFHLQMMGDSAAARPYFERALAIHEEVLGANHPDTAGSLNNLGYLLRAQGDYAGARPYYERALAIRQEVLGANHPDTALSLNNLGALLNAMGDSASARPYYERALAIHEEVLGANHPDTATSLNNLGYLLQAQGDYAGARPYYERALSIVEASLGPSHAYTETVRGNLAALERAMKQNY